jgi:methanogenic corrinoid protein MtbC1
MQTAQAINALRHQEQTGHVVRTESASAYREELERASHTDQRAQVLLTYQKRLFEALSQKQIQRADEVLGEALVSSTPEDLILNVIGPTLNQIGEAWENGNLGVATEHLATNYLRQRLLMWIVSGPPAQARPPIVLACAPAEWHEGSLLIMGALLRRRRYPVVYLGQAVPLPDLAGLVRDVRPSMAVLVAMTEEAAAELVDWPNWLPETAQSGHPLIGYGGRVFRDHPEWQHRMAGIYLGDTFQEGISTIERLLA